MGPNDVQHLIHELYGLLDALSQKRMEEPLIQHHELLKLDIARNDDWYKIRFLSAETQEPYRQMLQPVIQWMNDLHKTPHRELTEDEGKNNCLVPGKIALKKRSEQVIAKSSEVTSTNSTLPTQPQPSPGPPRALLRADSFGVKANVFHQECVLVLEEGSYRAETRSQKIGSNRVETKLNGGQLTPVEISQLQALLADPALASIRHRVTSHLVQPVSGEMLELEIPRSSGLQELVLSSNFDRPGIPFFYSGDGDIAQAQLLLKFLSEHVENNGLGSLDPGQRNGCQSAP